MDHSAAVFLINLVLALLAFFGLRYIFLDVGATKPIAILAGVLAAIVVFIINLGELLI